MEWININNSRPAEEKAANTLWFDVWVNPLCGRVVDVKYRAGRFYEQAFDGDGDYSHEEEVKGVTHWFEVVPPVQ